MEMAAIGMEMMAEWGADAVCERLAMLTRRIEEGLIEEGLIEEGLRGPGVRMPDRRRRAPHILSLGFDEGLASDLVEGLAAEGIFVAPRLGRMRISPHVFNDEEDADRLVAALVRRLGA
jgi:selenocysteine lyase/cysteine desulfurase